MSGFGGRQTRNFQQNHGDYCSPDSLGYCACPLELAAEDVAELVCSDLIEPTPDPFDPDATEHLHMPVIDLDLPCRLVPSATPGHSHLYIDKAVSFDDYMAILKALALAGIVQWGFHDATRERGFGSVRHPDRPKPVQP